MRVDAIKELRRLYQQSMLLDHDGPAADPELIRALEGRHGEHADCSIVAEAAAFGVNALLSCDKRMRGRLQDLSPVPITSPMTYWDELAIPHGSEPAWQPHPSNPMAKVKWWRLK